MAALARRVLGAHSLRLVNWGLPEGAALIEERGAYFILIDETLPRAEHAFVIGHELGEWVYREDRGDDPAVEEDCNRFADAILTGKLASIREIARGETTMARRAAAVLDAIREVAP
jgi:hypothetical protein